LAKKNKILSFSGKWMELENIILNEVRSEGQSHTYSLTCGIHTIQMQQHYEKQVTLRGNNTQKGEGKRRKSK
jgi:hypothetical protein